MLKNRVIDRGGGAAPTNSIWALLLFRIAAQPFAFYQLNNGWYLRGAPIWAYNFENDSPNIPLGIGLWKVWTRGKTVFTLFF